MSLRDDGITVREFSVPSVSIAVSGVFFIAAGAVLAMSSESGPVATGFWRFAGGAVLCGALTLALNGPGALGEMAGLLRRRETWIASLGFAGMAAFWYSGMRLSSVATTSALHNLSPLVLALTAWLVFRRRPSRRLATGIAAAVAGMVVLAMHSGSLSGQALAGDVLALISAGFLALYYVHLTAISREAHPWSVMATVSALTAVPLFVAALVMEGEIAPATTGGWLTVIGLALAAQVLGQSCLAVASRRLGAFGMTTITLAEPAFAAIMAAAMLGAAVHGAHVLGIALTAGGLWVILTGESARKGGARQGRPVEARPVGVGPVEVRSVDVRPVGVRSVGVRPVGVGPVGVGPVGVRRMEVFPVEARPAGARPA